MPNQPDSHRDDPDRFAAIMITTDETAVAIARSILRDAGIEHRLQGDGYRRFGARTFLGATLPPVMGRIIVEVRQRDFDESVLLLQGLNGVASAGDER